jgi:dTMP kinase
MASSTGDWITILATLSLAEDLAGGGGMVLALSSRVIPGLFFAAVGGIVADIFNRKRVMLAAELGRAGLVVSLAFAQSITHLVLVSLALEGLTLVFQPAKEATVPRLVKRNELVQANSLSLSAAYGMFPVGALVFLAIAPWGDNVTLWGLLPGTHQSLAFLVGAIPYLVSFAILTTLPGVPSSRKRIEGVSRWNPIRVLIDFKDGIAFVATERRIRNVVVAMTVALAGGGIIIVLGKPHSREVLQAGAAGWPALLAAFGFGAVAGILLVTIFGPRFRFKDLLFSIALIVAGISLAAAAFVQTLFGAVGWISAMGFGAGSAYVLGFAHLHEQADDALRGRTFAALLSLMRIGLLTAMMLALPAAALLQGVLPGMLGTGSRAVLLVGGLTMLASGSITLWRVRSHLIDLGHFGPRPELSAAADAVKEYRRAITGSGEDDDEPEADADGEDDG